MPKACPTCRNLFGFGVVCPNDGTMLLDIPELGQPQAAPPANAAPAAVLKPQSATRPRRAVLAGVIMAVVFVEIWSWTAGGLGWRPTFLTVVMGVAVAAAMNLAGHVKGSSFAIVAAGITAVGCVAGDILASAFYTSHFNGGTPIHALSGLPSILNFGALDAVAFAVAVIAAFFGVATGFRAQAR
jgi:hypothetical protein